MSDTGYNGWSNYETWNVNLWLSNDEGLYYEVGRIVGRTWDAYRVSQNIESFVREIAGERNLEFGTTRGFGDLGYHDLRAVDWEEIANAWMEDSE